MRWILLNRARDKRRQKLGGDFRRIDLDKVLETPDEELLALDEALERLAGENQAGAELLVQRMTDSRSD